MKRPSVHHKMQNREVYMMASIEENGRNEQKCYSSSKDIQGKAGVTRSHGPSEISGHNSVALPAKLLPDALT